MSQLRAHLAYAVIAARADAAALAQPEGAPIDWVRRHAELTHLGFADRLERTIAELDALSEPWRGPVPIREAYTVGRRGQ